uniref:Uncharacterized protein n=1 Tax=Acrobeloides nanus TaxID=290746 RepID=A0A914EFE4_9BILA
MLGLGFLTGITDKIGKFEPDPDLVNFQFSDTPREEEICRDFKSHDMPLEIDGAEIERVENFRYLEIDPKSKLSYKNHVSRIATKYNQAISALCRTIRKWTSKYIFGNLYKSTIEPIMIYDIEAWYLTHQNSIKRVEEGSLNRIGERVSLNPV